MNSFSFSVLPLPVGSAENIAPGVRGTALGPIRVLTVTRGASIDQVVRAFESVLREDATADRLWDLRETTLAALSTETLRSMVTRMVGASSAAGHASSRSAFVVSRDVDFGVIRMLMAHAENEGYGVELNVFRAPSAAIEWLTRPGRALAAD